MYRYSSRKQRLGRSFLSRRLMGALRGRVELPLEISGELVYQSKTQFLHEGEQEIRL